MQRIDAGQQLRLETLVGIALMAADRAAFRIDLELVEGAHMVGAVEHVEDGPRLPGHGWQAQVPGDQAGAGGLLDALPDGVVVDFGGRAVTRVTATPATAFPALLRRRVGEHARQPFAVPLIGPVQAGEPRAEVEQQHPGAGHRVQVPVEATAFLLPVQGQPGAPVQSLARPAQVETGQAEENQRQGAGGGDLLAHLPHRQEAVQHQHQVEEVLADRLGQHLAGVGVERDARPASLAWRRREKGHARPVMPGIDPQAGDAISGRDLDPRHQFARRKVALRARFDLPALGIERPGDLALETVERAGDAHDGQHQAGADAEEPMQLEDDFLEHDGATLTLTLCDGRLLYMGIIFITIYLRDFYAFAACATHLPGQRT
ncbi:conserved protein of unknown function [Ectopseudomonas oleovorans]|uniref:Uncharacterized protein n=1 Tax=Ectopseudomonas oleovorans TaxID=301 RepID=A0A653B6P6_ECTOL|nr:conserved protein of unknown function [Pseudomonas oleovorans]